MTSDAKWDTRGLERILKRLQKLEEKEIRWGFFENAKYGKDNDNLQVAQVAKWQEEGTHKKSGGWHIPPRPFFSQHVLRIHEIGDPVGSKFSWYLIPAVRDVFMVGYRVASMKALAKNLQEGLQQEILDWSSPPNTKTTEKQKGFNDPLIESGKMYDSVRAKIVNRSKEDA